MGNKPVGVPKPIAKVQSNNANNSPAQSKSTAGSSDAKRQPAGNSMIEELQRRQAQILNKPAGQEARPRPGITPVQRKEPDAAEELRNRIMKRRSAIADNDNEEDEWSDARFPGSYGSVMSAPMGCARCLGLIADCIQQNNVCERCAKPCRSLVRRALQPTQAASIAHCAKCGKQWRGTSS
jgi:hypothetical protein